MHISKFIKSCYTLLVALSIGLSLTGCGGSGYTHLTGQYVSITSDCNYFILDTEDGTEEIIRLYLAPDTDVDFSELTTGDIVEVAIVLIQNDGILLYTEVFDYTKKADGEEKDIKRDVLNEIHKINTLIEN